MSAPILVRGSHLAAVFGKSPYLSRWMLYHHLRNGMDVSPKPNERMDWGQRLEPVVLPVALDELGCERTLFPGNVKRIKHPSLPLIVTADSVILDKDGRPGTIEVKCVDWKRWKDSWTAERAPDHVEIQLAGQMMTGDGTRPFEWGAIACLVGGNELRMYVRAPELEVWSRIGSEVTAFVGLVDAGAEPDPAGTEREIPYLNEQFLRSKDPEPIDLTNDPRGEALAEIAVMYRAAWQAEKFYGNEHGRLRATLLHQSGGHRRLILPRGITVRMTPAGKGIRITVEGGPDAGHVDKPEVAL